MEPTFDIFEFLADGTSVWKGEVYGLSAAMKNAEGLAEDSGNEMKVIHVPTQTVLGTWPAKWARPNAAGQTASKRRA